MTALLPISDQIGKKKDSISLNSRDETRDSRLLFKRFTLFLFNIVLKLLVQSNTASKRNKNETSSKVRNKIIPFYRYKILYIGNLKIQTKNT
jgi:hypothetical protein